MNILTSVSPVQGSLILATLFILLDAIIIHVPPFRAWILKYLNASSPTRASQTRLVGQVAARTVGSVFLVLMFPSAIRTILDPEMRRSYYDTLYNTSEDSMWCIQVASAYFLYDTYICIWRYAENGMPFLIHGVLCCLAYSYPLFSQKMHYQGAAFLLWECSTPFLYLRWVLIKAKGDPTRKKVWQDVANGLFAMAFFFCRIVSGPMQSWEYYHASAWDMARDGAQIPVGVVYAYRTAMVVLNGLNYWWFSSIVRIGLGIGGGHAKATEATEAPSSPKVAEIPPKRD